MQRTTIALASVIVGLLMFHTGKNTEGLVTIGGFGHYEDDLGKVDGEWLFAKRRIYNEGNEAWAAPPGNPAW